MATRDMRDSFERLKFSANEDSPAFFEKKERSYDDGSQYRAEMLEYKRRSKQMPETYIEERDNMLEYKRSKQMPETYIEKRDNMPDLNCLYRVYQKPPIEDFCSSRKAKKSKKKCKEILPVAKRLESKSSELCNETFSSVKSSEAEASGGNKESLPDAKPLEAEASGGNKESLPDAKPLKAGASGGNKESLPDAKLLPNNDEYGRYNNPGKPKRRVNNYKTKKIVTQEEKKLLELLEKSSRFRVVLPREVNNVSTDTCKHEKSALADNRSLECDLQDNGRKDKRDASPPRHWALGRKNKAPQMDIPIVLSEVWDIEEEW